MIRRIALLASLATPAAAEPDRVSILLGSAHPGAARSFEQVNPGVFLTWKDRAFGLDYSVGAYRNSFGRASIAATAALPVIDRGQFQLALFGGLAVYPGNGADFAIHAGDVVPIAGVQARVGHGFVQVIPGDDMAVVAFGLTFLIN
jgi:hypothetical protein